MFQAFLIKYSEIGIKGKNRYLFEDALVKQIIHAMKRVDGHFTVSKSSGRIYVNAEGEFDYDGAVDALSHVFGISGICPAKVLPLMGIEELGKEVVSYMDEMYPDKHRTFKVCARRADKSYPLNSMEINMELGGIILNAFPEFKVDVHTPEIELVTEIRQKIYVYSTTIKGPGGMPVGTAGKAMLLLSGGIDSPVAGYMISRRGVSVDAVYFHAPPYTSDRAKQKVVDLAHIISAYTGPINLHVINFTDIQLAIYDNCPHDELTIIMRRYMMKIAQKIAGDEGSLALVTGESIGQVASQTMQSLACTDAAAQMPVFRPLIAFDKQDIIDIALKIGSYETSILPFEDCCTIFVAKHPVTKPELSRIEYSEKKLSEIIGQLLEKALDSEEIIRIGE